jgi:hypothetical protein
MGVDGKSIFSVAAMAQAKPGTAVSVAVAPRGGQERKFRLARAAVVVQSVGPLCGGKTPSSCSLISHETPSP